MALDLIGLVSKESGVALSDLGVHGSIALQMHAPESDIDFVVYGTQNFRLVEEAIARLVNAGKLSYIMGNRIEAARKFQGRYRGKIFMYNATKKSQQVKEKYGAYRYIPLDPVRFLATVSDDTETMYRPSTYKISGYKPLYDQSELDIGKIPVQVVSNIGLYRNVARCGSGIKVSGKLERVESTTSSEVFYQVVVGTATSEEEYIWPVT
jgi:predicted nucleotidyltransferase